MNFRYVAKVLGMLLAFLSATMLLPLAWSAGAGETAMVIDFAWSMAIGLGLGGVLFFIGRKSSSDFYRREGLAVVSLGWIAGAAVGALPYFLCPEFNPAGGFVDAYFESMSGFTTTGSTVLSDIDAMPRGLVLWRSFTQWLGGMGIVVLFVAVLPALGVEGKHLYRVEIPGIQKEGALPRIRDAASLLWKIYAGLTVAEVVLLMLGGLSFYESLNHTFTTLATGGFSTRNESIAAAQFQGTYFPVVFIIFMILLGTNFSLYIACLRGRFRDLFRDVEYRTYIGLLVGATLLITFFLLLQHDVSAGRAIKDSAFQVTSILTTTGYVTADFNEWPQFARVLLVVLMFVGGCAGSTGGAMKVARVIVVVKIAVLQVQKFFFPRMVKQVKIGGKALPEETLYQVAGFFIIFVGAWVLGTIYMSTMCPDLETAATTVLATLANIGPGLSAVGAVENFKWIPAHGKMFLSLCMVLGRLELFTVLVLLVPGFWKE